MKNKIGKIISCISCLLAAVMLTAAAFPVTAGASSGSTAPELGLDCASAILMEASTGKVLYEKNADEALPPASVTKIMTLLQWSAACSDSIPCLRPRPAHPKWAAHRYTSKRASKCAPRI